MSLVTWQGKLLLTNGKLTLGPADPACCCEEPTPCGCPSDVADWLERCLQLQIESRLGISGLCECAGEGPFYVIQLLGESPLTFGISDTVIGSCAQAFAIFITCESGVWMLAVNNDCYDGGGIVATKQRTAEEPYPWGDYTIISGGSGTVTIWPHSGWIEAEGCDNCD